MIEKKTKIIATIGPSSEGVLEDLILSGVDLFRFNTKHNEISWHNKRIKEAQKAADKLKAHVGILIDLQGPEIRIETREESEIAVKKGDLIAIGGDFKAKDIVLAVSNKTVFENLFKGDPLLIDDGFIELKVVQKKGGRVIAEVVEGGVIKNKKSLNLPEKKLNLSSLIDHDLKSLDMMAKEKIDFVALSFVRDKNDVDVLRKEMEKRKIKAEIISKIENREAVSNIDEIIDCSDAIMIARGDLGIEVPIEELAYLQRSIIYKSRIKRKPVIVATQMLYSMTENPRPTRAEATDIANAVFNRTDAVMLSEETAIGKYPAKSARTMAKIVKFNEEKTDFVKLSSLPNTPTELMIDAVVSMLGLSKGMDIIAVFTESGYTAKVLSSFRPKAKIIAITSNQKTAENLSLSYGVIPCLVSFPLFDSKAVKLAIERLKKEKIVSPGRELIIVSGKLEKRPELINSFSIVKT